MIGALLALLLSGCSDSDESLQGWEESDVEIVSEEATTGTTRQVVVSGEDALPMTSTGIDTTTDLDMIMDDGLMPTGPVGSDAQDATLADRLGTPQRPSGTAPGRPTDRASPRPTDEPVRPSAATERRPAPLEPMERRERDPEPTEPPPESDPEEGEPEPTPSQEVPPSDQPESEPEPNEPPAEQDPPSEDEPPAEDEPEPPAPEKKEPEKDPPRAPLSRVFLLNVSPDFVARISAGKA